MIPKRLCCPKCGATDFMVSEAVTVADWIEVRSGEAVRRGHGDWSDFLGMSGECGCGHRWRMRKATESKIVDDLARNNP
jgi:hypothetical protein